MSISLCEVARVKSRSSLSTDEERTAAQRHIEKCELCRTCVEWDKIAAQLNSKKEELMSINPHNAQLVSRGILAIILAWITTHIAERLVRRAHRALVPIQVEEE